ncbi:hypothetical protein MUK42_29519 [Musa troglodytarum]|uniref:TmcB/TmcC TPR repeats domain-containing protein n=1 Tax=Musa troglodytarum TaxID=320322 RepID=A0A9E7FHU7_9LILI|nr:hypothetical protein MUK42_29519 [Musa troglodytarum]
MTSAILIRTTSFLGSPKRSLADGIQDSGAGISFLRRSRSASLSPRSMCAAAQHSEAEEGRDRHILRRARSEADLVRSNPLTRSPIPERVVEEEEAETEEVKWCDLGVPVPVPVPGRPPAALVEPVEYSGGGNGKGKTAGWGRGGGDENDNRRIADYYQQMLRTDPSNPLLLRNYGRFLHEVEGDAKGAEECYGRAILASPGDGEVLSLYGKLVWETQRDEERAEAYFERAVQASPDDCYVLGSYAHFLWDAEDEEEEGRKEASPPLVEAF